MRNKYPCKNFLILIPVLLLTIASCKKDNSNNNSQSAPAIAKPTKLGVYEADSSIFKLVYMNVMTVGTQTVNDAPLFDTGSGGLVIDADGLLPPSMITNSGFTFTGDSTVVNGITITNQTSTVEYGDDVSTTDKVYGNLAYASVTIGDATGNIVIKRLPFFIYYKAVDSKGVKYAVHEFDVLGVSPEYDISFPNNTFITSPFNSFDPGNGLTKGFKMAALGTSNFSYEGNFVPDVVTLGLTAADLSSSSGFVMHELTFNAGDGYSPVIPATIAYGTKTVSTEVVFDTGTEPYGYIEDKTAPRTTTLLPQNTSVTVATTAGFNYSYTTSATDNLTYLENPTGSGGAVSIVSLEYFLNNEYLLDYTNHQIGLKDN
jgi:hypothetical protein